MSTLQPYEAKELFELIAKSDATAFRRLFEYTYDRLFFNAQKLLKSEYWAEEVIQEVFLQVWDGRSALNTIDNPLGWLFRVVSHKCFDRMRRRELELRTQFKMNLAAMTDTAASLQVHNHDLELIRKLVKTAVEKLPEQQQRAYALRMEQGLSHKEIAVILGISPNTVHNHLTKASQTVRNYIQTQGGLTLLMAYLLFF